MRDTTYYGMYRGIVVNNLDPELVGKLQIRVLPMFQTIEDALLPWAIPAMPISSGAGLGTGTFSIPLIGTFVWVFFEEGDIYQPVYFAEAQNAGFGIPSDVQSGYPNTRAMVFPSGIKIIVDDNATSISIVHPTQSIITMDALGKITISSASGIDIAAVTNVAITALGEANIISTGKTTITAGGNVDIKSSGVALVQAPSTFIKGTTSVDIDSDAVVNISSDATVNITGATGVNIN